MNYRIAQLLASEDATTAATKPLDINLSKPISRITVQMKGTNSTNVPTAHPAKMVSKIELVDGSNVLFSLSGIQCQAVNYQEEGRIPDSALNYVTGTSAIATFHLNFGRWLWDSMLALDPTKFNNPQLKITHNKASGGSAPSAGTLSVFAHVFDGKAAAPQGFLMTKEQYSYTLSASAKEKIDLATDLIYRFLMIRSLTAGKQPWENVHDVKLSEDNDNVVVINNEAMSDLIKLLSDRPAMNELIFAADLDGTETIYCSPSMWGSVSQLGMGQNDASMFTTQLSGGAFDATGDNGETDQFIVHGILPHGAVVIPFGSQADQADWYDVTKLRSLALTLTAGSGASGTAEIISQQVKMYK